MAVQTQIQTRRGTAASWTSTNPTLAAGEIGFESDTNKFKIGTGSTAWASLPYAVNTPPLTTKGDLYTFSTADARLAVGTNEQRLVADSVQTTGLKYVDDTTNYAVGAKGDLLVGTAADTVAALAVGADGDTIVADSSTSTGLSYQANWAAGKNKIINGDFSINQRGFTSNTTSLTYNFDRWLQANGGTSGTFTVTPQTFTPGAAPVAGYEGKNFFQGVTAAGANSDTFAFMIQRIEDVRTLAGQTATFSFFAKANSGTPKIALEIGQNFGSGGSPSASVLTTVSAVTISTSWARYSITTTVPALTGKTIGTTANTSSLFINLWLSAGSDFNARASSIGLQNNTFQIWGVQIEAGSTATAFQTATGTIQGELAACQRYYERRTAGGANYGMGISVFFQSGTAGTAALTFASPKRTSPSVAFSGITANSGSTGIAVATMAGTYSSGTSGLGFAGAGFDFTVASGGTDGRGGALRDGGAGTGYIEFSSEL